MSAYSLSVDDVTDLASEIYAIIKEGMDLYPTTITINKANVSWISINSHIVLHASECILRFGVPRYTWTFCFEGYLGNLKRSIKTRMNGKSEGMLTTSIKNVDKE
jgi:hypothetical protein